MALRASRKQVEAARDRVWAAFDAMDQERRYTNALAIAQFSDFSRIMDAHYAGEANWRVVNRLERLERSVMQHWVDPTFARQVGEHVFWGVGERREDNTRDKLHGTLRGITVAEDGRAYGAVEAEDGTFHAGPLHTFISDRV